MTLKINCRCPDRREVGGGTGFRGLMDVAGKSAPHRREVGGGTGFRGLNVAEKSASRPTQGRWRLVRLGLVGFVGKMSCFCRHVVGKRQMKRLQFSGWPPGKMV